MELELDEYEREQIREEAKKIENAINDYTDGIIQSYNESLQELLKVKLLNLSFKCVMEDKKEVAALLDQINYTYSKEAAASLRRMGYELTIIEPVITDQLSIEEQMAYKLKHIKVRLTRTIVKLIAEV